MIAALPAPVLVYPPNSVNLPVEDVVLDWSPVAGAKTYDVQVALDEGFNNMAWTWRTFRARATRRPSP